MNQIQSVRFLYSGTPQVFTIPRGVCCVKIKAWGAGGGGRIGAGADEAEDWDGGVGGGGVGGGGVGGGPGGYAEGRLSVRPGDVLTVLTGESGKFRSTAATFGGGGPGGADPFSRLTGSSGGGRSAILYQGVEVLTAGGGGGGASSSFLPPRIYSLGGSGGCLTGTDAFVLGIPIGSGGFGGTQTTGGAGGVNASGAGSNGQAGASLQGGSGGASGGLLAGGGGGGGGGYFGGGGGAGQLNFVTQQDSAGGGGSSYVGGVTHGATLCTPQNTLPDADSALFLPPKTDDPEYVSGVGVGGSADPSGNGLVVIQYQTPSPRSQAVTDLMISVAMEQAALSSILYAEAQKLEKAKTLGLREDQMLQINHSITAMTNSVADLETILESKLSLFSCGGCQACGCLCTEEETL